MTLSATGDALGKGIFLTLEGGDGTGKTTQADMLAAYLEKRGRVVCRVHEPGGTQLGEKIRELLLDRAQENMSALAELMLYEAARAQVVAEVIKPALARGEVVICDRFTDSTVAYQGYGRELGAELVEKLNLLATDGCMPDRTIMLRLDPELARNRVLSRSKDGHGDRMESAGVEFHRRTLNGFEELAQRYSQRIRVVNAQGGIEEVHASVLAQVADLFTQAGDAR